MERSERYDRILRGMSSEDAKILREFIDRSIDALNCESPDEEIRKILEKTTKKILEIEAKALEKLKEQCDNPTCTFCRSRAKDVKHMFSSENGRFFVCSECVAGYYEKLQEMKG